MTKHEQRTYVLSLVSIAFVIALGLYTHFSARAYVVNDDLIETINTKASVKYVDDQNKIQDKNNEKLETLFLFEITELRKDLRLKKDKP